MSSSGLQPYGRVVRSSIQHFAAAVLFSVVAVELLPEVRRGHDPFEVGWTFAAGVVLMLIIDAAAATLTAQERKRQTEESRMLHDAWRASTKRS